MLIKGGKAEKSDNKETVKIFGKWLQSKSLCILICNLLLIVTNNVCNMSQKLLVNYFYPVSRSKSEVQNVSFSSLINCPERNLRRTCTEAAGVPVLLVLCVCWGGGVYKWITNMLHAHSCMCTCMQANKKVKVKKSGTLNGKATGEFNNMWIIGAVRAGVLRWIPHSMPCCRFNIFAHIQTYSTF